MTALKPMRKKLSYVERLLRDVRRKPSPTVHDPRQLDLDNFTKANAFSALDRAIEAALEESK
jgi:hypothetical protein